MQIQVFTKENIKTFYLSPYVDYFVSEGKVVLRNDLFDTIVIAPPVSDNTDTIFNKLKKGIKSEEIIEFINNNFNASDSQKVLDVFIQNGIIE